MAWGVIDVLLCATVVVAIGPSELAVSPSYNGRDPCPLRCVDSGPVSSNWSVYHNLDQLASCRETMFYDFSLYDAVDDANTLHRISACTTYGPDWLDAPAQVPKLASVDSVNATFTLGWWPQQDAKQATPGIRSLAGQMRQYLESGHANTNNTVRLYAQVGQATIGVYVGSGFQNEDIASSAVQVFADYMRNMTSSTQSIAMQLCGGEFKGNFSIGIIATSNGTFGIIQDAFKSWERNKCLSFGESTNLTNTFALTTPLITPGGLTTKINTTWHSAAADSMMSQFRRSMTLPLSRRNECRIERVQFGLYCPEMAKKCGISGDDFMKYNPAPGFCNSLQPGQPVCCSAGTLPDIRPKPNADGTCYWYKVAANDDCSGMAAANGLTIQDLEDFNKQTWAWNGCGTSVWAGTLICLSSGRPPMPAPVSGTVCGPQVPGTVQPGEGTDLASLNPCPLNACCDVWGQCGTTEEFCVATGTGAPGTARPGTNGCISNCGTDIKTSGVPAIFRKVGYFEGYNLNRRCLYQDASQIDTSKYTHLHFAFGFITHDFEINTGDALTSYEFAKFKALQGPKRIISFGGWDFSTGPETYTIFRDGVTAANRQKLATNIANFVNQHNLDGVDIDWEYPGAPDIPNIPPGSTADGLNYLRFLITLRGLLPGKSLSIAAPASYWYLKGFRIAEISKTVDYIVYMTYDLHGQWDADNKWSQPGCPSGHCLRSNVNLTETINSLAMITKAGVPSNQVVVGVTSYGRSHGMAQAGCFTPECLFIGGPLSSTAAKGPCTDTAGYMANAEIQDIINTPGRVNYNYVDAKSDSNILVYDNTQWVGWMSPETKAKRSTKYQQLQMGGTTDWAIDLESFRSAPGSGQPDNPGNGGGDSWWSNFKDLALSGGGSGPIRSNRTGNWTQVKCSDRPIWDWDHMTQSQRWAEVDADHAYADAVRQWKAYDHDHKYDFSNSVLRTFNGPYDNACQLLKYGCDDTKVCDDFVGEGTGPAAYFIYNSFVLIHRSFNAFHDGLHGEAATKITLAADSFIDKFAPLPPEDDNKWLFFIIDIITLGATAGMGKIFNSWLTKIPYYTENPAALANLKDTVMAIISGSTGIAKGLYTNPSIPGWTLEKQHDFKTWISQAISGISALNDQAVFYLFNGTDDAVNKLGGIISDGKLIPGVDGQNNIVKPKLMSGGEIGQELTTLIFGYSIPVLWRLSGQKPFILDSGYPCDTQDPAGVYLTLDTRGRTRGCYNNKLYFLVMPDGLPEHCVSGCHEDGCLPAVCRPSPFSPPPGVDYLDGKDKTFGDITVEKIIQGSVKTYIQNGNTNGGDKIDITNRGSAGDLFNSDITTPGFFRLPVCTAEMAHKGWGNTLETDPNYPCLMP